MIAELYLRKPDARVAGEADAPCRYGSGDTRSSAIVGGNIPLGTGTALASKILNNGRVTAIFLATAPLMRDVPRKPELASVKNCPWYMYVKTTSMP